MEQSLYFFSFSCRINNGVARRESVIFGFMYAYFRGVMLIKYVFFLNITPKKLHEIKNILIFVAD